MNRLMGGGEVGEVGAIAAPQHHSAAPSGRSRYASPAKPAAVIAGAQFPDLAALARELDPPAPAPLPWWIRNHDLLAGVACICIAIFAAYAIGGLK